MEERSTNQEQKPEFPAPKKSKSGKGKKILLALLALLLVGGVAYGAYWYGQEQVRKANEAKVAELQNQLTALHDAQKKSDETPKDKQLEGDEVSDKDVIEIGKALEAACNNKMQAGASKKKQVYFVPGANGREYNSKITKDYLLSTDQSGNIRYHNGYAQIGLTCRDAETPEEPTGGYVSIAKRQTDDTWKEVFGLQQTPSCELVNRYKVPSQLIPECYVGQEVIKNQN